MSLLAIIVAIVAHVIDKNNLPGFLSIFALIKTMLASIYILTFVTSPPYNVIVFEGSGLTVGHLLLGSLILVCLLSAATLIFVRKVSAS